MNNRWPFLFCLFLGAMAAYMRFGTAITNPEMTLLGGWDHPDSLSNHWLLVWMAEQIKSGEGILHNSRYYLPIGDAPWLAGNGSAGFWMAPYIWVWGWPKAVPYGVLSLFCGISIAVYAMGRSLGIAKWATPVSVSMVVFSPFIGQELSASRFSQVDILWLCLSCACFWQLLRKPSRWLVFFTAISVALTAVMYWYYLWFFVMIAILSCGVYWGVAKYLPLNHIVKSGVLSCFLIFPYGWLFWRHWEGIPGTDELRFPSTEAIADSLENFPVNVFGPDPSTSSILGLALALVGVLLGRQKDRGWGVLLLAGLVFLFGMLSLGVNTPIFELIYGWLPPLQRFWWPSRHIIVVGLALALLAGFGLDVLFSKFDPKRHPLCGGLLAFLIPLSLILQGQPITIVETPLSGPPEPYMQLDDLPEGGILQLPLNPKISRSQAALYFQIYHRRSMLNGHAQWVDRVRPEAWDKQITDNILLHSISEYELAAENPKLFCNASSLQEIRSWGVRYVVLDPALYPERILPMLRSMREGLTVLLGAPILRHDAVLIWDLQNWTNIKEVELNSWVWPSSLQHGDGTHPVKGRMGENPYLAH